MTFEEWLRTVCFQKPTLEAYDLAKSAWEAATLAERERCATVCDDLPSPTDWNNSSTYEVATLDCAEAIRLGN